MRRHKRRIGSQRKSWGGHVHEVSGRCWRHSMQKGMLWPSPELRRQRLHVTHGWYDRRCPHLLCSWPIVSPLPVSRATLGHWWPRCVKPHPSVVSPLMKLRMFPHSKRRQRRGRCRSSSRRSGRLFLLLAVLLRRPEVGCSFSEGL